MPSDAVDEFLGAAKPSSLDPSHSLQFFHTCLALVELIENAPTISQMSDGSRRHLKNAFESLALDEETRVRLRGFLDRYDWNFTPTRLGNSGNDDDEAEAEAKALADVFRSIGSKPNGDKAIRFAVTLITSRPSHGTLLIRSVLMSVVSSFELLLRNGLLQYLERRPEFLQSTGQAFQLHEIVAAGSVEAIQLQAARSEVEKLLRCGVDEWSDWFKKNRGISTDWESLVPNWKETREVFFRRNLIVHTGGVVTKPYIDAIGAGSIGESLSTDAKYAIEAVHRICQLGLLVFWSLSKASEEKSSDLVPEFAASDATVMLAARDLADEGWWDVVKVLGSHVSNSQVPTKWQLEGFVLEQLALKRTYGVDAIRGAVSAWDVQTLDVEWVLRRAALLDDFDGALKVVDEVLRRNTEFSAVLWTAPLFAELREAPWFDESRVPPLPEPLIDLSNLSVPNKAGS